MTDIAREKGGVKHDLVDENFTAYFYSAVKDIPADVWGERLDTDLARKLDKLLRRKKDAFSFTEKVHVLSLLRNCSIYIVTEYAAEGHEPKGKDAFTAMFKASRMRKNGMREAVDTLNDNLTFCVGTKEVMDTLATMNLASVGALYKLLLPLTSRKITAHKGKAEFLEVIEAVIKFLVWYEGNKKRFYVEYGLSLAEWFALLYYYTGEKSSKSFQQDAFQNSLQTNVITRRKALGRLYANGYLHARGITRNRVYSLLPKGRQAVHDIFDRIIFNQ